jgi:glycosyltransferase involved in cell wall biosynthesis
MPRHTGGCEVVVDTIASKMSASGIDVCVAGADVTSASVYNGYRLGIGDMGSIRPLVSQLSSRDCVLVYSDSYFYWPDVLREVSSGSCRLVLCTVGFFASRKSPQVLDMICKLGSRARLVVHSEMHEECSILKQSYLNFEIIPNGVDLEFFSSIPKIGRSKPRIVTVANCYPGKGHAQAIAALNHLSSYGCEFTWTVCCTTPEWPIAKSMTRVLEKMLPTLGFNAEIMLDRSRYEVCNAIVNSNVMLHASISEVAPLVILESMASSVPWVAFEVGNLKSLGGGIVCGFPPSRGVDGCERLSSSLKNVLEDSKLAQRLGQDGVKLIESTYTWDRILTLYRAVCFE